MVNLGELDVKKWAICNVESMILLLVIYTYEFSADPWSSFFALKIVRELE